MNAYVDDGFKYIKNTFKNKCRILDAKYEKVDLNKVMDDKWKHPTKEEQNVLLALLKSFDGFLNGTLIMWNISQVKF